MLVRDIIVEHRLFLDSKWASYGRVYTETEGKSESS